MQTTGPFPALIEPVKMSDTPGPSAPTAPQPIEEGVAAAGDAPTSDVSTPGCPICEFIEAGPCGGQHKVRDLFCFAAGHLVCMRACMQPHFRAAGSVVSTQVWVSCRGEAKEQGEDFVQSCADTVRVQIQCSQRWEGASNARQLTHSLTT
jgi:hypothetical protein